VLNQTKAGKASSIVLIPNCGANSRIGALIC
jgi:hypothetical protein